MGRLLPIPPPNHPWAGWAAEQGLERALPTALRVPSSKLRFPGPSVASLLHFSSQVPSMGDLGLSFAILEFSK